MKTIKIILVFLIGFYYTVSAQDKYFTREGHAYFVSKTEPITIDANNNQVGSILDVKTGKIVVNVIIKSFKFQRTTSEDHFNENYMESDKYPKSTFDGIIKNINKVDFSKPGTYQVEVSGKLTIHGVTKDHTTTATIEVQKDGIIGKTSFKVKRDDYGIKVQSTLEHRVAKDIEIEITLPFKPYNK